MQVPICRHIKTNGLQCRAVAVRGSAFCYFHGRLASTHELYRNRVHFQSVQVRPPQFLELPALEDRASVQLAVSLVVNALATECITEKRAYALFRGIRIASVNAHGLRITNRPRQSVSDVYKEPWGANPAASPDIAPPGKTIEIPDPPTETLTADSRPLTADSQNPAVLPTLTASGPPHVVTRASASRTARSA